MADARTVFFKYLNLHNCGCIVCIQHRDNDVWFNCGQCGVPGVARSNGANFGFEKSKMAADGHFGYTKVAITS